MIAPIVATAMLVLLIPVTSAMWSRSDATQPPTTAPTIPSTIMATRLSRDPIRNEARKPATAPTTNHERRVMFGMSSI